MKRTGKHPSFSSPSWTGFALSLLIAGQLSACAWDSNRNSSSSDDAKKEELQSQAASPSEIVRDSFTPPQVGSSAQAPLNKTGEISKSNSSQALTKLESFQTHSLSEPSLPIDLLQQEMKGILAELDSLAITENFSEAEAILSRLDALQRKTFDIASRAPDAQHKGIWLLWSEKLLFTLSATRHFFSEMALNQFEKAVELNDDNSYSSARDRLAQLIHPDHERRLVSILRRVSKNTKAYAATIELLAISGGSLARLNLYQRFITEPSIELANAIAKAGLPRVSDLVGENAQLSDGIPFVPNTRPAILEGFDTSLFRDFKNQWKELQNYFDHIRKIPSRFTRSREKWREIHEQVESIVGLLSVSDEQKAQLRKDILQTFRSSNSPEELVYKMNGIEFREGDIVLLQTGAIGGLWETFTLSGSMLSHLVMVTFGNDGLPYTVEMNFGRMLVAPLDLHADRFTIVRPRNLSSEDRRNIRAAFESLMNQNVRYDFRFDSRDSNRLYCSELAAAALKRAQLNHKPILFDAASARAGELLRSAGLTDPNFFGQGSYLASPDFEVIAQQIQSDPIALIRGQLLLEAFSKHIATSSSVKLYQHPQAHQLLALSALAQTTDSDMRRALGPQSFLFVVMTLDRLLHAIDSDAYGITHSSEKTNSMGASRITELKTAVEKSLQDTVPKHLSTVFPKR